jgi:cytidylate kinase
MESRIFEVLTQKNKAWVTYQSEQWYKKSKPEAQKTEQAMMPFITISREYGCAGFSLGELLANELNKPDDNVIPWAVYDRMLLEKIHNDYGIHHVLLDSLTKNTQNEISDFFSSFISMRPSQSSLYKKLFTTMRALAHKGHVIMIGRGAVVAAQGLQVGFNIRIYAPEEWRIEQIKEMHDLKTEKEARSMLKKVSRERDSFVKKYFKQDLTNPYLYDIMINNAEFKREDMVDVIITCMKQKDYIR